MIGRMIVPVTSFQIRKASRMHTHTHIYICMSVYVYIQICTYVYNLAHIIRSKYMEHRALLLGGGPSQNNGGHVLALYLEGRLLSAFPLRAR